MEMRLKQVLDDIIAKKHSISSDPEAVNHLVKKWKALRKFCVPTKRAKLVVIFVAFCEGKIGDAQFCQKAEDFQSNRRRQTLKKPIAPKPKERYFWKPYQSA